MRTLSVHWRGRGVVRGLFFSATMVCAAYGCDKSSPPPPAVDTAAVVDAGLRAGDVGASVDAAADLPPPTPVPFSPPWTTVAPDWKSFSKQIATADVGRISGEIWGTDRVVRAVVRSQCGFGAMLQAVYEGPRGLQVTPAMPVRFFGLQTPKGVEYREDLFGVTVKFTEDSPDRLAGLLKIVYDDNGEEKKFVDLQVDAVPLTALLQPLVDTDEKVPTFPSCHPSGRFYARAVDGREARGLVNAGLADDGKGLVVTMLLTSGTGLRFVVYSPDSVDAAVSVDLAKGSEGSVRAVVEAFYTAELTSSDTAAGPNLESEKASKLREGTLEVLWTRKRDEAHVELRGKDLVIPLLLDGPLRGTTFAELKIEAAGFPDGAYPKPPTTEPLGPDVEQQP